MSAKKSQKSNLRKYHDLGAIDGPAIKEIMQVKRIIQELSVAAQIYKSSHGADAFCRKTQLILDYGKTFEPQFVTEEMMKVVTVYGPVESTQLAAMQLAALPRFENLGLVYSEGVRWRPGDKTIQFIAWCGDTTYGCYDPTASNDLDHQYLGVLIRPGACWLQVGGEKLGKYDSYIGRIADVHSNPDMSLVVHPAHLSKEECDLVRTSRNRRSAGRAPAQCI